MKLLNKTTIYTSITTVLLLLTGTIIVYRLILKKIDHEDTEHLVIDKRKVIQLLQKGKPPIHFRSNIGEKISIEEIPVQTLNGNVFKDYSVENGAEEGEGEEELTVRELTCQTKIEDICYEIKITRSLSEGREIRQYITSTVIFFLIFSLAILFVLNMIISRRIWAPFYNTMAFIKQWSIKENIPVRFKHTSIDEFNELNTTVNGLIKKIKEDYSNLKEFTENISHETQTPLAIISTKIELLMQEINYSEHQKKLLSQSYESVQRLKKLNETLITLTRIENNQFAEIKTIDLSDEIRSRLTELGDFIDAKKIHLQLDLVPVKKDINPIVLAILLNNLLINSIKHNLPSDGFIHIHLDQQGVSIKNSALTKEIDRKHVFERFKSYSTNPDSIGLGLSIIKKITDILSWKIAYRYKDNTHEFEIRWPDVKNESR
jgi:signal transduction histidine kinase